MPNIDFDQTNIKQEPVINDVQTDSPTLGSTNDVASAPTQDFNTTVGQTSSSQVDYSNPNSIMVTVKDKVSSVVILFGPPSCGKTMTLVRLSRYLKNNGYTIAPERTFRPSNDLNYQTMCKEFPNMINSDEAAASTGNINFMLVKIIKDSTCKCQILEGPGELYFNPKSPNEDYPTYIDQLIEFPNRKIWVFILEPNWMDEKDRLNYVDRIRKLRRDIKPKDKIILLLNKVDTADDLVLQGGVIKPNALQKEIADSYPGIFELFLNKIPISNWFTKYNCTVLPFQTGKYKQSDDGQIFISGNDSYPRNLWQVITKMVRG